MADDEAMVIEPGDGHGFTIRLGARHYPALLSADDLEACRATAQKELEHLTEQLARHFSNDDLRSHIGWLFTPDYRRPDDLQGLFGWLFLFAVAGRLVGSGYPKRARVADVVPAWIDQRLEQAGLEIIERRNSARSRLRNVRALHTAWQATRFLAGHFMLCLRKVGTRELLNAGGDRSVLVKMPLTGSSTRYGPLDSALSDAGWQLKPENFDAEPGHDWPLGWWRLLAWLSPGMVVASLADAVRLKQRLADLAAGIPDTGLARSPAYEPSIYALARRMLQIRLWNTALKAGRPRAAVLITSLTRPEDRMLIACLKRHRVPVCQVLPRPVNPDRPAEKLLEIDRTHPETLPDFYVARDGQSRDALIRQGIESSQIAVGVPTPNKPAGTKPENSAQAARLLILLTVLDDANTALCRMLADALHEARELDVIARCHPGMPLNDPSRAALDRLHCGWREQPGAAIGEQAIEGTLAVTATSTSAIEAARYGAAVVWAPFVSEITLFQRRFMQQVGVVAGTKAIFVDQVEKLTRDADARNDLARKCQREADEHFSAERSIPDVVLEWLEGF